MEPPASAATSSERPALKKLDFPERRWSSAESVVFRKTREQWGGLSNMAAGYPITLGTIEFKTSEALYQAMRFPSRPDVQQLIAEQASPMAAKMKSKPFRDEHSHPTWDDIRPRVMFWCLHLKLAQNWLEFGSLLRSTGAREIVEESHHDRYWGAVRTVDSLAGSNVLGCLLVMLRDRFAIDDSPPVSVKAPDLGLMLTGVPVPTWAPPESGLLPPPSAVSKLDDQLGLDWG